MRYALLYFNAMDILKINNTSFNVSSFKDWTREDFQKQYAGHVSFDLDSAWELIQMRLKQKENKEEVTTEQPKKNVRANKKGL